MKRILSFFIILFVTYVIVISNSEAIFLKSEYQSYFGNVSFLNYYQYNYTLSENWLFSHSGSLSQSRNKRFHRYSRNADLSWQVSRQEAPFIYTLHLDYNAAVDKARPELESYQIDKTSRRIGVNVLYTPVDSLDFYTGITYVHSEESNSRHSEGSYGSNGYQSISNIRYNRAFEAALMSLDTFFNVTDLDFDFSRRYGAEVGFDIFKPVIDTELSFNRETNKIYLLNDEVDTHIRSNYHAALLFRNRITDNLHFRLGDRFHVRDNRLRDQQFRNYLERDNSLFTDGIYHWQHFRFSLGGEYRLFSRSFKDQNNSRDQEFRVLNSGFSYYFSERDSVVATRSLKLIRTSYTVTSSILDNDQRIAENQISAYYHLRDNIKLISHFNYTNRKEVYLKSGMSANNKTTRIYNLLPSLNIALNRNLLLLQDYHLRADYDDFKFEVSGRDRMYRRFSASYSVLTGLPWSSGYADYTPDREYFYRFYNLVLGLRYKYDTNSSGNRVDDAYEVFSENEYHTLDFELFRRIERLKFKVRPRFIWSNIRYEFNHLFEFTYLLPDRNNYVMISANSTGRRTDELLWRINALVYFAF